jgi:endonuclease YncB( thermonuclease family)
MVCVLTLSVVDLWFDLWSSTDTYGVMVCVLTLSEIDLWFDLWSSTDANGGKRPEVKPKIYLTPG